MAILTTRPPGADEGDRIVTGCIFIDRVNDDPGEETKIFGDREKSIVVPYDNVKIKFWDYYKNPEAENLILWASGLFRYVSNETVLKILKAIGEHSTNAGEDVQKIISLITHFEKLIKSAH